MALRLTWNLQSGREERVGEKREENSHARNQCIWIHRIICPHSTVLRILPGDRLHLPFLSVGFSYLSWFYIQSEESSFIAIIAIIAFSLLRSRQWLPIASWISVNEIDHRLQDLPHTQQAHLTACCTLVFLFSSIKGAGHDSVHNFLCLPPQNRVDPYINIWQNF